MSARTNPARACMGGALPLAAAVASILVAPTGTAQRATGPTEEVVVTGSFIRRRSQLDSSSPLVTVTREDIQAGGTSEPGEIIERLTINTGSENNPDAFTQNFSTGTSNVNLRGLGVGSTLVLINGRRQTQSAVATDRGDNFVDMSSLPPMIAVDRIEILKDGATALYGSDAVAGVVNLLTRKDLEGLEIDIGAQTIDGYPQNEARLGVSYGQSNESTRMLAAVGLLRREPLTTNDRRLSDPFDDLSQAGNPGSFLVPSLPGNPVYAPIWAEAFDDNGNGLADALEPQLGLPPVAGARLPLFADPDCVAIAAEDPTVVPTLAKSVPSSAGEVPIGLCRFDFGAFYSLVPQERRTAFYIDADHRLTDRTAGRLELHIADNEAERSNSPSFPFARFPVVPATHPDNPFGTNVGFIGRVAGAGGKSVPSVHTSLTSRLAVTVESEIGSHWHFDGGLTMSRNEFAVTTADTLIDRFEAAVNGYGGAGCEPVADHPGSGACRWFNPFGTALTGTGTINSPALLDDITGDFSYDAGSELATIDVLAAGEIGKLRGRALQIAAGVQRRRERIDYDYDPNTNADNFVFFSGVKDFKGSRDIGAVFAELDLPLAAAFDLRLAARHETYGGKVASLDPKVSFLWRPAATLSLRGSFGTSFRAPSLFQAFGTQTTLSQLIDPTIGIGQFFPVRTRADTSTGRIRPEEAGVVNVGVSWSPVATLETSIDYWAFDYRQVIIQQNPQAVLNAAAAGDPTVADQVVRDPLSGLLLRVDTFYANAASLETDGIDFTLAYDFDFNGGVFGIGTETTLMTSYVVADPQAGRIDALGRRNASNFATSAPDLRTTVFASWENDRHRVDIFVRHIAGYDDEHMPLPARIDSQSTVDARYRLRLGDQRGPSIAFGAINLFGEDPPHVRTNGGYDSKVHDPRGRVLYARAQLSF